jgi:cytochrome P450
MHRRKDIYGENSDEFFPERWESLRPGYVLISLKTGRNQETRLLTGYRWQYLPFNGGPRICIGQQFALTEASYCIVRILQTFKAIEKRDDSLLSERITVTVSVRPGTLVGLTPA